MPGPVVMTLIKPFEPDPRVRKEAAYLAAQGHEVRVLAWDYTGSYPPFSKEDGFLVERLGPTMPPRRLSSPLLKRALVLLVWLLGGLRFSWRAFRRARKLRPAVLLAHDLNTLHIAVASASFRKTPVLYDSHEDYPKKLRAEAGRVLGWLAGVMERILLQSVDGVITVNESIASRFRGRGFETIVLMNTVNIASFESHISRAGELAAKYPALKSVRDPVLLYQGSIVPDRGTSVMIEARRRLGRPAGLLIVGDSPVPGYLEDLKDRYSGEPDVTFLGRVPMDDVPGIIARASLGLIILDRTPGGDGNHENSLPNKLFDYLAAGVPVVSTDFPEIRRVVEGVPGEAPEGSCGLLVEDPTDPDELAACFRKLLDDSEGARAMGKIGQARVRSRYDFGAQAQHLGEMVRKAGG